MTSFNYPGIQLPHCQDDNRQAISLFFRFVLPQTRWVILLPAAQHFKYYQVKMVFYEIYVDPNYFDPFLRGNTLVIF
jgi:hypothetical protein